MTQTPIDQDDHIAFLALLERELATDTTLTPALRAAILAKAKSMRIRRL